MCGIAGIAGGHDRAPLGRLAHLLRHRGPDGHGVHEHEDVGLVSTRLAILDIPGGAQPMHGEHATIVFNGEVYNAPELRRELEADGARFASDHSDTEVLLRGYERHGVDFLPRLNGMFAFAIHDRRRRTLVLARDRFGIKPLYYHHADGRLAFASELRALLAVAGVERRVDEQSLWHYVSLRFVPGDRSIVEGVRRVPPGHWAELDLDSGRLRIERWWQLRFEREEGVSRAEWLERLRGALRDAVSRWTLADVPLACSLSGGLDSSAIVGLLAESGQTDLRTYTLGFTSEEDANLNELPLAAALAARHGTDHRELVVDADDLLDDLLQMVWALDEPYGGGLPSWYVFRAIAGEVKVALTGTGGDELFGNYRRFVPFEAGRLARLRGSDVRRYHFEPSYYFSDTEKRELLVQLGPPTAALLQGVWDEGGTSSPRDGVVYLDMATQLPDEFLHMTDRFSMAFSLEARTPYLDHELVELVAGIPPELRTAPDDPKGLLREAVADLLTPHHLEAPKRGFVFPLARWLRGELRPLAEQLLGDEHLAQQGLFRPGLAERLLEPHIAGRRDESERLWPLLMFQLWHLLYVEEALTEAPAAGWRELVKSGLAAG